MKLIDRHAKAHNNLTENELRVLYVIICRSDDAGRLCGNLYREIDININMDDRKYRKALKSLEKKGYIRGQINEPPAESTLQLTIPLSEDTSFDPFDEEATDGETTNHTQEGEEDGTDN